MKRRIATGVVNLLVFLALWRAAQWLAIAVPVRGTWGIVHWVVLAGLLPASFLLTRLLVDWLTD